MESLLCNEIWLMSPNVQENDCHASIEDSEGAIATFLDKETRFLPASSYFHLVGRNDFISNARFRSVAWIIKSQRRLDLRPETVFAAVNYLDRFISLMSQCQGWKWWMFELLSVACLAISSKFNETEAYPLHEFQEDLETSFAPSLVQRMELTVLKALDWRVDSTTPFSYIHLLIRFRHGSCNKTLVQELSKCVTQLLLDALLDPRFLEFPQFVMAVSAVRAVVRDLFPSAPDSAHLEILTSQHHKDIIRCMEKLVELNGKVSMCGMSSSSSPSSPVTVLNYEFRAADLSTNLDLTWSRKRKRDGEEEEEEEEEEEGV